MAERKHDKVMAKTNVGLNPERPDEILLETYLKGNVLEVVAYNPTEGSLHLTRTDESGKEIATDLTWTDIGYQLKDSLSQSEKKPRKGGNGKEDGKSDKDIDEYKKHAIDEIANYSNKNEGKWPHYSDLKIANKAIVKELVGDGALELQDDPEDRRKSIIVLKEKKNVRKTTTRAPSDDKGKEENKDFAYYVGRFTKEKGRPPCPGELMKYMNLGINAFYNEFNASKKKKEVHVKKDSENPRRKIIMVGKK